jgi:hypothetical protein
MAVVIVNRPEVKPIGGSAITGSCARTGGQDLSDPAWITLTQADFDQSADHGAHHRMEEGVAGHLHDQARLSQDGSAEELELDELAASAEAAGFQRSSRLGNAEALEIMLADEQGSRFTHSRKVERVAAQPPSMDEEGALLADQVAISAGPGIKTGRKSLWGKLRATTEDVLGQIGIERTLQKRGLQEPCRMSEHFRFHNKGDYLAEGVYTGIGAPSASQDNRLVQQPGQALFKFSLHRALSGLTGKT